MRNAAARYASAPIRGTVNFCLVLALLPGVLAVPLGDYSELDESRPWAKPVSLAGHQMEYPGLDYLADDVIVDDTAEEDARRSSQEKRAWNSNFSGGLGKRAWNSNFSGGLGKRAWNSNFSGGLGKRAWNSNFTGGLGKRAWNNSFSGGIGKRAWTSNFSGGIGKRGWNSGFSGGMGKRSEISQGYSEAKRGWSDLARGQWGKRGEKELLRMARGLSDLYSGWAKGTQLNARQKQQLVARRALAEMQNLLQYDVLRGAWGKRALNSTEADEEEEEEEHKETDDEQEEQVPDLNEQEDEEEELRSKRSAHPFQYYVLQSYMNPDKQKMAASKRTKSWLQLRGMWGKRSGGGPQTVANLNNFGQVRRIPFLSR